MGSGVCGCAHALVLSGCSAGTAEHRASRDIVADVRGLVVALCLAAGCGSSNWVELDGPDPDGLSEYALWVFAEDDVWLGGRSIWHFDGADWTETPLPIDPAIVLDFWGFAPDDLWAIGGEHAFRWNGAAWSEVPATTGVSLNALTVVWGASSTDIWVANSDNSRLYHWDGVAWTRTTLQFVVAHAIWGSSSTDIWLTGISNAYHYNGATWTEHEPTGFVDVGRARGLWGFGENDVWAVGGSDDVVHWDGATWAAAQGDDFGNYQDVWGPSADNVFAVGSHGDVAHYDGNTWSLSEGQLHVRQTFSMIHGSSPTNIWATAFDSRDFRAMVLRYSP